MGFLSDLSDVMPRSLEDGDQQAEEMEVKAGELRTRRFLLDGSERINWDCSMLAGDDIVLTTRISCPGLQRGVNRCRDVTERERFSSFSGFVDFSKEHAGWLQQLGYSPKDGSGSPSHRASSSSSRPVFELEFDNRYSWFAAKTVQLRVSKVSALPPRPTSFEAALAACEPGSRWEYALQLLGRMRKQAHITPDAQMFNVALNACKDSGKWEAVLQLIGDMRQGGVRPDAKSFEIAISACESAGQAEHALRLMDELDAVVTGSRVDRSLSCDDDVAFLEAALREAVSRCPAGAQKLLGHLLAAQESLEHFAQTGTDM